MKGGVTSIFIIFSMFVRHLAFPGEGGGCGKLFQVQGVFLILKEAGRGMGAEGGGGVAERKGGGRGAIAGKGTRGRGTGEGGEMR